MLRRSKINARKVEVRKAVGAVTLELELSSVKDVTLEKVLDELAKIIPSEDTGATISASKLREDYEAMAAASKVAADAAAAAAAGAGSGGEPAIVMTRKTAAELGNVKADAALTAVRAEKGAFNWFLCTPELCVYDALGPWTPPPRRATCARVPRSQLRTRDRRRRRSSPPPPPPLAATLSMRARCRCPS